MINWLKKTYQTLTPTWNSDYLRKCSYAVTIIAIFAAILGCTRRFYRNMSDDDIVGILAQKNQFPKWDLRNWYAYPDPRARFADPTNPDFPPKPPDDYAAELLSPNPQRPGKAGVGEYIGTGWLQYIEEWDRKNREVNGFPEIDNPLDQSAILLTAAGYGESAFGEVVGSSFDRALRAKNRPYRLTPDQVVELSVFNGRDHQDRREDLYNAALPVSLQRFAFAAQFFASEQAIREIAGRQTSTGQLNLWQPTSTVGVNRLFPTGATLLLQFANKLVLNLGSGNPKIGISTLSLQITQPLLAGGGFAVTLEPLTLAERGLLYGIRSYYRFRQLFYSYIISGDSVFNAPYSYSGLITRGIFFNLTAAAQGYIPTLLLLSTLRDEIENVRKLTEYLQQFKGFAEGSDVPPLQVDQVEQQLIAARTTLLVRRLNCLNALDIFKLQLGIPTNIPIELDTRPVLPITLQLGRFNLLREQFAQARRDADAHIQIVRNNLEILGGAGLEGIPIEVKLRVFLKDQLENSAIVQQTDFREKIIQRWHEWEKRTRGEANEELKKIRTEQRELLNKKARLETQGRSLPNSDVEQLAELQKQIYLALFELVLRDFEEKRWEREGMNRGPKDQLTLYREVINLYVLVLTEARQERLGQIKDNWPSLPPVCINGFDFVNSEFDQSLTMAVQYALANRIEIMNARGQIVDAWRQIRVVANSLLGVLNVEYSLASTSPSGQNIPLDIGGSRTTNELILNGQLPIVRRLQRNNYRSALIAYQSARRGLMATEDFIMNDVRTEVRQLRQLAENYKIQQRAVEIAYALVENSLDVFLAPPDPRGITGGQTAGNAAALTQQLLSFQNSLLVAQDGLYTVWTNYLLARIRLFRDIDQFPLDERGVWKDECTLNCVGEPIAEPGTLKRGPAQPSNNPRELPNPATLGNSPKPSIFSKPSGGSFAPVLPEPIAKPISRNTGSSEFGESR